MTARTKKSRVYLCASLLCKLDGLKVKLVSKIFHRIVCLRDFGRAERVGLDKVSASQRYCLWISLMASGSVSTSRSLLPLRSFGWSLEALGWVGREKMLGLARVT